ncbi:hypothetical protein SDC9_131932 [bioreactor metagenome]|uniref:DUF4124 domain-containing protein n=1 Tax=bioreactor metagenome TaxID=1076179 RepID=A0A645D666_9ZZZZ
MAHSQVYRCGNSYSAQPCAGGREVDVSEPLTDPGGPKSVRIYLCKRGDDRMFWLHEPCSKRGWTIERVELVPRNLDWDDQVAFARGKRNQALSDLAPVVQSGGVSGSAAPSVSNKLSECRALDERVNWLDSLGRAGGGGYTMDWIREERRKARDKQYRLRC